MCGRSRRNLVGEERHGRHGGDVRRLGVRCDPPRRSYSFSDVMMRTYENEVIGIVEEIFDCLDFRRGCRLIGAHRVETDHHDAIDAIERLIERRHRTIIGDQQYLDRFCHGPPTVRIWGRTVCAAREVPESDLRCHPAAQPFPSDGSGKNKEALGDRTSPSHLTMGSAPREVPKATCWPPTAWVGSAGDRAGISHG
jgi:hypothetical protein